MTDEKKVEEVIPSNLILYIGEDSSYLSDLESKYKEIYPNSTAVFSQLTREGESQVQALILEIRRLRPKLIFIDYSTQADAMLHITRVWIRQNFHTEVAFIGLCDYAKETVMIKRSIMTNMKCVHIKSSEFEAICFDIQVLAFPEQVENHGFATAKLAEPYTIFIPSKLTNITPTEFRIESNVDLSGASEVNLRTFFEEAKILHSPFVKVVKQENENLYYNYDYAQYLSPVFEEQVEKTDDMSDTQYSDLKTRNQEKAVAAKNKLNKWVSDHADESSPKFVKTLIIDKTDALFDQRPMSDSFKNVFRTQAYLKEIKTELMKIKPHVIVIHLEQVSEEELKSNEEIAYSYNTGSVLMKLIQVVQNRGENYKPYIIAFNTVDKSTEMLQETFKYENIIAVKEAIQVDLVVKMCDLLRAKIEPALIETHRTSNSIYLQKNDPQTYAEIQSEITVKAISETDIYFDCTEVIPEGTVFRMIINHSFFVTVMPMPAFASFEAAHFGIIHGIGEVERQGLRQFINDIFFQELQKKKAQEAFEVAEQKRKFLEEKEAAKQKEIEEKKEIEEAEAKKKKFAEEEAAKKAENNKEEE